MINSHSDRRNTKLYTVWQDTLPTWTLIGTYTTSEEAYFEAVTLNTLSEDCFYYVQKCADNPQHTWRLHDNHTK